MRSLDQGSETAFSISKKSCPNYQPCPCFTTVVNCLLAPFPIDIKQIWNNVFPQLSIFRYSYGGAFTPAPPPKKVKLSKAFFNSPKGMADPNGVDPYYSNIQDTNACMNIFNNTYPNHESTQNGLIDFGSSQPLEIQDFAHDPNLQRVPLFSFGNNGLITNQILPNPVNGIHEPTLFPLPGNVIGDNDNILVDLPPFPESFDGRMNYQIEANLGNEIQQPFSFPSMVPPITEQTGDGNVEYDGIFSNQINTNPEQSMQLQFGCQCCEILREIVHIGRRVLMKLEIHGRVVGVIFHAIIVVEQNKQVISREMIDFYHKSHGEVKQFLRQYCMKRKEEGYTMMTDAKSSFFEALCVGLDWIENVANEAHPENIQMGEVANGGDNRGKAPLVTEAANNNNKDKNMISLTEQRKRVKEMTVKDLEGYLHLPRKEAAQKLGLSETVVHNIWCKGSGDAKRRWPHRKIQSMKKEIMKLEAELADPNTPQHARDRASAVLRGLQEELDKLYNEDA